MCSGFLCGKIPKKHLFRWRVISNGLRPFEQRDCERVRSQFGCGEKSNETGRFRGRESNGDSVPLAHDLAGKV